MGDVAVRSLKKKRSGMQGKNLFQNTIVQLKVLHVTCDISILNYLLLRIEYKQDGCKRKRLLTAIISQLDYQQNKGNFILSALSLKASLNH